MGMFDLVQCDMRLPVKREARVRHRSNPFQSKSIRAWEIPDYRERVYYSGVLTITITHNGFILGPDGRAIKYTGIMQFYGGRPADEFEADVIGGVVQRIRWTPQ